MRPEVAPTPTATADSDTDSDASDDSARPPQRLIHDVSNVPDYLRRPYNWPQAQHAKGWQFRLEAGDATGGGAGVPSFSAGLPEELDFGSCIEGGDGGTRRDGVWPFAERW